MAVPVAPAVLAGHEGRDAAGAWRRCSARQHWDRRAADSMLAELRLRHLQQGAALQRRPLSGGAWSLASACRPLEGNNRCSSRQRRLPSEGAWLLVSACRPREGNNSCSSWLERGEVSTGVPCLASFVLRLLQLHARTAGRQRKRDSSCRERAAQDMTRLASSRHKHAPCFCCRGNVCVSVK